MARGDWHKLAEEDAAETFENFVDEMTEQAAVGEVSDDMFNDYHNGDAYHHDNHTDKAYDLLEAAELLDELGEYEETDSGLWEGLAPREAISAQAAYTYANAVYSMWCEKVEALNTELGTFDFDDDEDRAGFVKWWVPAYVFLEEFEDTDLGGMALQLKREHGVGEATGFPVAADWIQEHQPTWSSRIDTFRKLYELAVKADADKAARLAEVADED
jgi:hypothetical protein